jgi:hypothetical protein
VSQFELKPPLLFFPCSQLPRHRHGPHRDLHRSAEHRRHQIL